MVLSTVWSHLLLLIPCVGVLQSKRAQVWHLSNTMGCGGAGTAAYSDEWTEGGCWFVGRSQVCAKFVWLNTMCGVVALWGVDNTTPHNESY